MNKISDWKAPPGTPALLEELDQLELLSNVMELETQGFTVVPPEKVGSASFHEQVRDAVVRVAADRFKLSVEQVPNFFENRQENVRFMLWEDPIFESVLLNPAALGLVQYLVGTRCILSLCNGWLKGSYCDERTPIHVDWTDFSVSTLPAEPNTANFNYLLTDYSREEGALSFVPGSHRLCRFPTAEEVLTWADRAHPIEAPAGSMVVWGDHTWHGSFERKVPGLRIMMLGAYARPHLQTQEPYRQTCTQEVLDRNPVRFAALMDQYGKLPFGRDGVDLDHVQLNPADRASYCSLFDQEPSNGRVRLRPDYDYYAFTGKKTISYQKRAEYLKKGGHQ